MLAEAAASVPFMSLNELKSRLEPGAGEMLILDVRERQLSQPRLCAKWGSGARWLWMAG